MTRKVDPRTPRALVPASELPPFTPVPRRCNRHDGWTAERQRGFIEALATTGSVRAAAKAVDMAQEGAYALRRQPGAESFRAAWQAALDLGVQRIEDVAMDRALNGVEEDYYVYGKQVGTRRRYNDRLLMFMLRNRAPERFAAGGSSLKGLNAVGKMEKRRLKKKWRKAWEAEQEARRAAEKASAPTPAEARASLARKVEALRRQVMEDQAGEEALWRRYRPDTRAAWLAWEELRCRDLGREFRRPMWAVEDAAEVVEEGSPEGAHSLALPPPGEEAPTPDHAPDHAAEAEALLAKQREEAEREAADERLAQQARESEGPRVRTLRDAGCR